VKTLGFLVFIIFTTVLSLKANSADSCNWSPHYKTNNSTYAVFEIDNSPVLWTDKAPTSPVVEDFHKDINAFTNTNQTVIRQNQLKLFLKHLKESDPGVQMMQIILSGKVGKTVKVRCLELLLLDLHLTRVGKNYYTEYGAYIFTKQNKMRLIYKSSDDASVPQSEQQKVDVKSAYDEGYELLAHLHLHPFNMNNPSGDVGGAAWPSGAGEEYGDMTVYTNAHKDYKLKQALVTNGFDTLILTPAEFTQLKNLKKTK
jgi:hypothetical protein